MIDSHTETPDRNRTPALWIALATAPIVIAIALQRFGETVYLTRLDRVLDPARMATRDFNFWNQYWDMGIPQFQTIGYWIPFDAAFLLGRSVGLPPWISERLFVAAVVGGALWGFVRLADALKIGRPLFRLLGGVAYVFAPIMLTRVAWQSPFAMGVALLPWVLLPLVLAARGGSPRRAAARSGLAVMLIGGANAAITLAVLPVPLLFLLTRERGRRRASLMRWWALTVPMAMLWWLVGLYFYARYAPDVLGYTEQPEGTVRFTPLFEVLRGTADWVMRLVAINPAGRFSRAEGAAVLATALIAALGLAGLSRRSLPERRFLVLTLLAGVTAVGGGFGGWIGNPAADVYVSLLEGPLAAFRNVFKFQPLVVLPLTLGLVHGLSAAADRCRAWSSTPRWEWVGQAAVAVVSAVAIVCAGYPLFDNQLTRGPGFEEIPAAWNDANRYLDEVADGRVLIVPGIPDAEFDWGYTQQLPVQWGSDVSWAIRSQGPLGGVENLHYLDAIELATERGGTPELAAYLRRGGFSHVLLPADQLRGASNPPPPEQVSEALLASGLERSATFGPSGYGFGDLHQVEIYELSDPARTTVYPESSATWLSGDIESTLNASSSILGERPYLLAFEPNTGGLEPDEWLVTDGNQAYSIDYGFLRNNRSYVHGPELPSADVDDLGDGRGVEHRTTQDIEGVESVTASSVGPGPFLLNSPSSQPSNAIDGDPVTSWGPRRFDFRGVNTWGPEDPWWEVRFEDDRPLDEIEITLRIGIFASEVPIGATVSTEQGSVITELDPVEEPQVLDVPRGETSLVRITFDRNSYFEIGDVIGIREIEFGGEPAPSIRLAAPNQLGDEFSAPNAADPAWLFTRNSPSQRPFVAINSEPQIRRTFTVPKSGEFSLLAEARAQWSQPLLQYLGTSESLTVVADTTWGLSPAVGPHQLVDGDPQTSWRSAQSIAERDATVEVSMSWSEPTEIEEFTFEWAADAAVPSAVVVESGSQRRRSAVAEDGSVSFRPFTGTDMLISIEYLRALDGDEPIALTSLDVPALVESYPPPIEPASPYRLSCDDGPTVRVGDMVRRFSVDTTVATLFDQRRISLDPCAPESLDLDAGSTTLDAGSGGSLFTIEQIALGNEPTLAGPVESPVAGIVEVWNAADRRIGLPDGDASILVINELFNRGWEATIGGERLEPVRIDGWRQAFRVPAGDDRVVNVVYGPNLPFRVGTSLGLAAIVGLLIMAAWADRERRDLPPIAAGKIWPPALTVIIVIGAIWTTGVATVALPVLWLLRRHVPAVLPWLAFGGLTIAGVVIVRAGAPVITAQPRPTAAYVADGLAAVSLLAVFAAALPRSFRSSSTFGSISDPAPDSPADSVAAQATHRS